MVSSQQSDYKNNTPASPATSPPHPQFGAAPATGMPVSSPNPTHGWANTAPPGSQGPVRWSSGLCGCFDDCSSCCLTCWCPCVTFGRISEIVGKGSTSCFLNGTIYAMLMFCTGCACCITCGYRSSLRQQYNLEDSPCGDCLVHCCCEQCALCQEYRELTSRGFDMSIGWQGNVERQNRGVAMPPIVQQGMTR